MGSVKVLKLVPNGKHFEVRLGPKTLGIVKSLDVEISVQDGEIKKKRRKKIGQNHEHDEELKANAMQLARVYAKMKKQFYRTKAVKGIDSTDKEFKYFVSAIEIVKRHNANYKKFLQAQINGLSFVAGGKGIFPRPYHLTGEAAETRLLDFIRMGSDEESGEAVQIEVGDDDRRTPLMKNRMYLKLAQKVREGTANLRETVYVRELQSIRKGKTAQWVENHIDRLLRKQQQ